jgi:regulatory protein
MTVPPGGEPDGLAPVIPLFGRSASAGLPRPTLASSSTDASPNAPAEPDTRWHTTWTAPAARGLHALGAVDDSTRAPDRGRSPSSGRAIAGPGDGETPSPAIDAAAAEQTLLKRLRGRSLSVREAHDVLRAEGLDQMQIDEIIDACVDRGYLDDAALAEQLVHKGLQKRQGRGAVRQALVQRGLDREVIDVTIDQLPDDEEERALEFALGKARTLRSLPPEVGLRRLVGQLQRRGFNGATSMRVARQALGERPRTSGVRFTD